MNLRPLLIAEACNPEWVSIPLEGWSLSRAISELTNAHLVTQIRNRDALLRAGLVEGKDFTAIDSEAVARRTHKLAWALGGQQGKGWTLNTALSSLSYRYFEKLLWQQFGPRIANHEFDLVHRITPSSPTIPSRLATLCKNAGVPMVLGPLNGGLPWPPGFDSARRREREWLSYVRSAYRILPGSRPTLRDASAIIAGSRHTASQQPPDIAHKVFYIPENGIDPARFSVLRTRIAQRPLRAVFLGRLVPYKGPDMLLEAAAPLLAAGDLTIDFIGDGPMKLDLVQLATDLGVAEKVRFPGWIDHADLPARLAETDLLTFPSIREFGGAVVLEAMAVGVVPVIVDYGGPAELATSDTGFLIPLAKRPEIVASLRKILTELVANPSLINDRSAAARQRAMEHFAWPVKAREVLKIYERVCRPSDSQTNLTPPTE
jgi:glycosyltransferase involved in cell wall biosynthesis